MIIFIFQRRKLWLREVKGLAPGHQQLPHPTPSPPELQGSLETTPKPLIPCRVQRGWVSCLTPPSWSAAQRDDPWLPGRQPLSLSEGRAGLAAVLPRGRRAARSFSLDLLYMIQRQPQL